MKPIQQSPTGPPNHELPSRTEALSPSHAQRTALSQLSTAAGNMLRRGAATLNGRAAAWLRRLPLTPAMPPPARLGHQHPQAQLRPHRGGSAAHPGAARGYARMARRIPVARPDGYSTSDGEAEEPDAREVEEEVTDPVGSGGEGNDSEYSEVEGYMMDFGSLFDGDGDGGEEGTGGEGKPEK
ncbi:hypothetical protein U9M48_018528 [Paspalum notatum var. saurae]|uniref:Uncharacterized protein n=1 Tax=Paspalum notatum var. saurae TaxID=547442 RepID=A0AAQ3TA71_PASNO